MPFPIQGSGAETRSFCHVDDLVAGVMVMREKGEHLGIYHVGTTEEVAIADLARRMAAIAGREIALEPSAVLAGSTERRCPDISKLMALGYRPQRAARCRAAADASTGTGTTSARRRPSLIGAGQEKMSFVPSESRACRRHRRQRPGRMLPGLRA